METIIGKEFPKKVIPLIDSAKRSINTVVFDWRWYPNDAGCPTQLFNQALVRASRRGVKIQAVVNNDSVVNILNSVGILARHVTLKNLIHAKLMIIDDSVVVIGSHNYTQNAFSVNQEISVILPIDETMRDFFNFFQSLWQA